MNQSEQTTQSIEPYEANISIPRRFLFARYLFLAYAITWISVLPLVLASQGIIEVSIHWHFVGAFGPTIAAFSMFYVVRGRNGIRNLGTMCIQWRGRMQWIAIAVAAPISFFAFALILDFISTGTWYDFTAFAIDEKLTTITGAILWLLPLIAYGIFEEIGWRGFALPYLQSRYSVLVASTILWLAHGLWHIPMFFYHFNFDFGMIIGFFIGMFFGTFLLTFVFNSSKGSVLVTIVWHTTFNLVSVVGSYTIQAYTSIAIMIVAVLVLISFGRRNLSTSKKMSEL